jgi:diguanylate cyclase (GGDEF)-like protein/PAS domain S-box-containing protein
MSFLSSDSDGMKLSENVLYTQQVIDYHIPISIMDTQGIITDVNGAFCNLSGYSKEEILGNSHHFICSHNVNDKHYETVWNVLNSNNIWSGELQNRRKDGTDYWVQVHIHPLFDAQKNKIGYVTIKQNIDDRKALEHLASTDTLTKLYNRSKLNEVMANELNKFRRFGHPSTLIICDLDNFKLINDQYGHIFGDTSLKTIASTIKNSIREYDIAARWGGEEFCILLPNTKLDDAVKVAEKIRLSIEATTSSKELLLTASFGVSEVQKNEDTLNWFQRADRALYMAKKQGKNCVISH